MVLDEHLVANWLQQSAVERLGNVEGALELAVVAVVPQKTGL